MTDDKKHDDKDRKKLSEQDRKKLSDEELKDVAGGAGAKDHNTTRSNR
ncbi:MAG: hypothetical protein ABGY15_07435 [bacterium]